MRHAIRLAAVVLTGTLLAAASAQAAVVTKTVEYTQGDTALEGFVVYDDAGADKRPGVLIVHQWMGAGDYEKRRAKQLAEMGYVAFVADIYGKGANPADQKEAGALVGKFYGDRALLRARVQAGLDTLMKEPTVDTKRVAAIGYCFGGTTVLELARSGADIAGIVSFHGNLNTPNPADAKNIKTKLLVLHGADDPYVPPEQVAGFKKEMAEAGKTFDFVAYPGAVHAFTIKEAGDDNSKGAAYNADADTKSWAKMKEFFAKIF